MAKFNAIVLMYRKGGYIVTTQIGVTGFLKTNKQLFPGDYINVDIVGEKTIEFKNDFWGPEFKIVDSYIEFWNKIWKKTYDIHDISDDSFTVKVGNKLNTIHKDFGVLFSKNKKKNIDFYDPVSFSSAEFNSSFKSFKKCIELGVCKKEVEITFTYYFPSLPFETSLIKILSCHVNLIDNLK
jgi:hypothetical protein